MTKPFLLVFVFLLGWLPRAATAEPPAPEWRLLPNAPHQAEGGRHDDVFFLDENLGWVCNLDGRVYRTTDGGVSWRTQVATLEAFRSIAFATPTHGWLGSLFDVNLLFETLDGGETWTAVTGIPEPRPAGICGLWVADRWTVYGVGKFTGPATLIKSSDAGQSWRSIDLTPWAGTIVDCHFADRDKGIAVGSVGVFLEGNRSVVLGTTDGGETWEQRYLGPRLNEWGWKISFPTELVGYVSLERDVGPEWFLKTEDGGLTWTEHPFRDSRTQGIGFATDSLGWIGGDAQTTFETTDGGVTWSAAQWGPHVNRFFMLSETLGYAVGTGVYKYSVEPVTSAPDGLPPALPAQNLAQNYPNPFNPTTVIEYTLEEETGVRLIVYDVRGDEVTRLVDALRPFGEHRVTWDGTDDRGAAVASGLYFYRLETDTYAEVRRMVLIR